MLDSLHDSRVRAAGCAALLLAALLLVTGCASAARAPLGPVVEPETLVERLDGPARGGLMLIDVRDPAAFEREHIGGAVRLDAAAWKKESHTIDGSLEHVERWRERLGSAGIDGRVPVVIYDDGRMTEAARIWFILQHFGHPSASVLNGGFPAIRPLLKSSAVASGAGELARAVAFRPQESRRGVIGLSMRPEVRSSIERGETQVLDARTSDEYVGKLRHNNPRGGHLPTAINLPHAQMLDERGRLKSPQELARLLEDAGFERGRPIVAHCESGGRSSLAAMAAERAGFGPVRNYYGSFSDWSADLSCPVESGRTPD